jgi:hypothetical protein
MDKLDDFSIIIMLILACGIAYSFIYGWDKTQEVEFSEPTWHQQEWINERRKKRRG